MRTAVHYGEHVLSYNLSYQVIVMVTWKSKSEAEEMVT